MNGECSNTPTMPLAELRERLEQTASGCEKRARQQGSLGFITDTEGLVIAANIRAALALLPEREAGGRLGGTGGPRNGHRDGVL